jgi:pimeloyl-ACP methyl ester carboxylesterase
MWVIIVPMSTILIVLLLVVGVIVATSVALGRNAYQVESARDTEYLELEGTWVRYNVIGGGPSVLLVHGWLSSSRIWEQLAPRLAQRFTVYTLDLTGFGGSDKPLSGYGVRNGSRLLYAFCAHFGLTRTGVIGHDLGGAMAVKLAADHQDVVGRLVLVATPADEEQIDLPTPLWLATLPVLGPIFYTLGRAAGPVRRLWMRHFVADPQDLTEEVVEDAGRSIPAAASQTLSISRREIARGRLVRQARIIKTPLLLIAGEDDQIVDPQAVSAWASSVDQAEICLLDECGHLPMIERTAEFNAQVLAFLTGDARYLDYAEAHPETEEGVEYVEDKYAEEAEEVPFARDDEAPQHPASAEPPEETTDLGSQRPETDHDFEADDNVGAERREERPNVFRKRGGRYSSRDEAEEPEQPGTSLGDGIEGDERPRSRPRRTSPDKDFIPQVPEDLFDWPEPRDKFRTGERPRTGNPEDGNDRDEPEEPSRF